MKVIVRIAVLAGALWAGIAAAQSVGPYQEPFRPQLHFSPPQQWMNDPNGMVYLDGEYHLFYQYNPYSNKWGPMHWGHAVSRDLVHWQNLPVALYPDEHGAIFSGSAVVDRNNTSGLGSRAKPPLVAIFAYHNHLIEAAGGDDFQSEGVAYSLDRGRTWIKYAGNPVLKNQGSRDFRDPKVAWFEPTQRWIMTLAVADHVSFYSSKDLLHWDHESDFGQEWGEHNGVWECPDLFPIPVEGEHASRYVLLVSINPGAPNGGSATQYFIGGFDGHHFELDADLQQKLRYQPARFPAGTPFADFNHGLDDWTADGSAFATARGISSDFLQSYSGGEAAVGSLRSPTFMIDQPYINFELGGGHYPGLLGLQLLVDGKVVRTATGDNGNSRQRLAMSKWDTSVRTHSWDVSDLKGKEGRLEAIDGVAGDHGYAVIGRIAFADQPARADASASLWLDYGTDDYAGVTWSGVPASDGRHLFLGWMSNWGYAQDVPTTRWRSAMTLPRELHLVRAAGGGLELHSLPVAELRALRGPRTSIAARTVREAVELTSTRSTAVGPLEVELSIDAQQAGLVRLAFANDAGEETVLRINRAAMRYELDRSKSGAVAFRHGFGDLQTAPMPDASGKATLHIFLDRASVEVFLNDGATVFTAIVFPKEPYSHITLSADREVSLLRGTVYPLASIWPAP